MDLIDDSASVSTQGQFVNLYVSLAETTSISEKIDLLAEYFAQAPNEEIGWAVFILCGGKLERAVTSRQLREWASASSGVPLWLVEESYHIVGDLAETVALLVSNPSECGSTSLITCLDIVRSLKGMDVAAREVAVRAMWRNLSKDSCLVFNKVMTGALRVGVSRGLVTKGLSRATGVDATVIAHRLLGQRDPGTLNLDSLRSEESVVTTPYPFYLSYALEDSPETLGAPDEWLIEWKWDGIRAQIVCREGHFAVWSRGEELITDTFPELGPLAEIVPVGTVLDGEIVAWNSEESAPDSFGVLQQRLNRKRVNSKLTSEFPVAFIAYDLLELHSEDLRSQSMEVRRNALQTIFPHIAAGSARIVLSDAVPCTSWEHVKEAREASRDKRAEGLMLKRRTSSYGVGRRRGDWWKWKVDPLTCDAVLIYAQRGHGRRADLYTDYTFAVWNGDTLVPFAKAYSGLTDSEIRQVDAFVKSHTRERFGPVRTVEPELVFEIGFEGIQSSRRHKSGVAVRFPRILRWRRDKPAAEADTVEMLTKLAGLSKAD